MKEIFKGYFIINSFNYPHSSFKVFNLHTRSGQHQLCSMTTLKVLPSNSINWPLHIYESADNLTKKKVLTEKKHIFVKI